MKAINNYRDGSPFRRLTVSPFHPGSARGGSALIVVLWVVGLLSMLVAAFAFDMNVEAGVASIWKKRTKAQYLARGGFELARMALLETADSDMRNPDPSVYMGKGADKALRMAAVTLAHGGSAELTRQLGEGEVLVNIAPENARMNVNSLIHTNNRAETFELWEGLFESAGVPLEDRDTLVDCLLDWVDENEASHLNGAESSYYESLTPPYEAKNGPIDVVDELMLIKGFDEKLPESEQTIYEVVAPYLTTFAENEKLNINAVSADTLVAFLNLDPQLAQDILEERAGPDGLEGTEDDQPFKDLGDLLARLPVLDPAIGSLVAFNAAGRYNIKSSGMVSGVRYELSAVIYLADTSFVIYNWSEGESPP